jgi:hypothetical protein
MGILAIKPIFPTHITVIGVNCFFSARLVCTHRDTRNGSVITGSAVDVWVSTVGQMSCRCCFEQFGESCTSKSPHMIHIASS